MVWVMKGAKRVSVLMVKLSLRPNSKHPRSRIISYPGIPCRHPNRHRICNWRHTQLSRRRHRKLALHSQILEENYQRRAKVCDSRCRAPRAYRGLQGLASLPRVVIQTDKPELPVRQSLSNGELSQLRAAPTSVAIERLCDQPPRVSAWPQPKYADRTAISVELSRVTRIKLPLQNFVSCAVAWAAASY